MIRKVPAKMAIIAEVARDMALDSDVDADTSPLGMGSAGTVSTPDTEVTPPESPVQQHRSHLSSERLWAKKKLSQLTQEEKVSMGLLFQGIIQRASLMSVRSHSLPLLTSGGRKPSPRKGSRQQRRVMDQMVLAEEFSSVVQR